MLKPEIPAVKVTLAEVRQLIRAQRNEIYIAAQDSRYRKPMVYLHSSAGWYTHMGSDEAHYQFCLAEDGEVWMPKWAYDNLVAIDKSTGSPKAQHTWRRNTGALGIAALAGVNSRLFDGGAVDFGDNPVTDKQIEAMAQLVAIICQELGLPVDYDYVRSHAEQADEEGSDSYGPRTTGERFDIWTLKDGDEPGSGGGIIRGKANWYQENGIGV